MTLIYLSLSLWLSLPLSSREISHFVLIKLFMIHHLIALNAQIELTFHLNKTMITINSKQYNQHFNSFGLQRDELIDKLQAANLIRL